MVGNLFKAFFGCSHKRTTFPLTTAGNRKRTYVVCLECGQEFNYDWTAMHMFQNSGNDTEAASALSIVDSPSPRNAATANAIAMR
jgi:hypothetical protein